MRTDRQLLWPYLHGTKAIDRAVVASMYRRPRPDAPSTRMLLQQPDGEPPSDDTEQ